MPMLMKNGFATIGVVLASALSSFVFGASPSAAQVNCSRVLNERCSQTYRVDAGNATHTSQGKKEAENEVTVPSGYVVVNFREINESSQTGGGTFNVSFAARGTISNVVRQYASESSRISDYKAKVDALYQGSQGSEKAKLDILRNQLNALSSAASTSSSVNTNTDVFTLRATSQYQCTRMVFGECLDGRGGHGKGSLIVDLVFVGDNPSATLDSIGQQITQLASTSRENLTGNGTSNPSYIIETSGQPAVAVFESRRESFSLGCAEIRDAWGVTDRRGVSGDEFQRSLRANPVVADLPCNGTIQHVALSDESPQLLLVRHRDGNLYRHYINSIKFPNALRSGSIQRNNGPTFRATFSRRGNDFQSLTP